MVSRLETPGIALPLPEMVANLKIVTMTFRAVAPMEMEDGPWFAGAVRGVLGHALHEQAEHAFKHTPPDEYDPRSAFAVLFRAQGQLPRGLEIPKPFVIETRRKDIDIFITVRLFGFAAFWKDTVAQALVRGLKNGISLKDTGGLRVPLHVEEMTLDWKPGLRWDGEPVTALKIILKSPLAMRRGKALVNSLDGFLPNLLWRLEGLARWGDMTMIADLPPLLRQCELIQCLDADVTPTAWERRSGVQNGRTIPQAGLLGSFHLTGALSTLMPALNLGQFTHTGHGPTFGLGHFDVIEE